MTRLERVKGCFMALYDTLLVIELMVDSVRLPSIMRWWRVIIGKMD